MHKPIPNIAIFASGSGSNFQAIADAIQNKKLEATIALLVCDNPQAFVIERAQKLQIETFVFNPKNFSSKADYETFIAKKLLDLNIHLVVLAGYMRIIGPTLLAQFPNKIINIHPALLPSFPGAHGIKDAYEYGVKVFGVTVHFVDAGVDTGTIIDQESFKMETPMTIEEVEEKIHQIEHHIYPKVLQKILHL